ncbi:unnamed protein product [Staurois parvus]|uniref:Uncharacterized protein n=1 Tax=Staurois parvus TaxID=386267 RepID=A0ABN9EV74_9NEOB|nr:unnamed protein product [Staurois parvus]
MASLPLACARFPGSAQHRDPVPAVSSGHSGDRSPYGTSLRGPDNVITDWPISDHMQTAFLQPLRTTE